MVSLVNSIEKHNILVIPVHIAALVEIKSMICGVKNRVDKDINFFLYANFYFDEKYFTNVDCKIVHRPRDAKLSATRNKFFSSDGFIKIIAKIFDDTRIGVFFQEKIFLRIRSSLLKRKKHSQSKNLTDLIRKYNITSVLTNTDRSLGIELSAYLAARSMGLPFVTLSFAYSADIKSSLKLRKNRIYYSNTSEGWNTVKVDGDFRRFYRPHELAVLRSLDVPVNNPWVLGGSYSDLVLVDSDREKERIVSLGGERNKYITTGHSVHDEIFKMLEGNQINNNDIKIILISLPQYWEHGLVDKNTHFKVIKELLNLISRIHGAQVICSLHPKMSLNNYFFIDELNNVKVSTTPLKELIPYCDMFLCTYSTTATWALMCSKKVVLFDHIGLGYTDFLSEFNLPIFFDNQSLSTYVSKEIFKSDYDLKTSTVYSSLSPFDGKCVERISKAILGIVD